MIVISAIDVTDNVMYFQGKLKFNEKIRQYLSFPFRTGYGLDYKKTLFIGLLVTGLPVLFEAAANRLDLVRGIDILGGVSIILIFLIVVAFVRSILEEINSLLNVRGAKKGEARVNLGEIYINKERFESFRRDTLNFLYLNNKVDKLILMISIITLWVPGIPDYVYRYEISGGDLYYTIFGLWRLPIFNFPIYVALIPYIVGVAWTIVEYVAFLYLIKIPFVLYRLGSISKFMDEFNIVYLVKGYIRKLNKMDNFLRKREDTQAIRGLNNAYTTIWRISNTISKISFKIGAFVIVVVIYYFFYLFIYWILFPATSINWGTFYLFTSFGYITIIIAILIFILPLVGFHKLLVFSKSIINGYLQDLYEKLVFRYFVLRNNTQETSNLRGSIKLVQDALIYTQSLPVWPFTVPQLIRLGFFSGVSAIIPQVVRLLFK